MERSMPLVVNDCDFGYRDSVFKRRYKDRFVILNVVYRLNKIPRFNIAYGAIREKTGPIWALGN